MLSANYNEGELKKIAPEKIIKEGLNNELSSLFLGLGIFYNDLKNILLHSQRINEFFEDVEEGANKERGEFGGIKAHLDRLLIGTLEEFFVFLNNNKKILKSGDFKRIYESLNKEQQARWDVLVEIANKKNTKDKTKFSEILVKIRNNIAFHYPKKPKVLEEGFIEHFFKDIEHDGNEAAYYSLGKNMYDTRFFFCDAVAQRWFRKQIASSAEEYQQFSDELTAQVENLHFVIVAIMKEFIRKKRYV